MHSFYFGTSREPIFGVYHAAGPTATPDTPGIVLCYPLGHEYIRAHRAFRNLAVALSRRGFHVLRFDYYGTGDSGGDSGAAGPRRSASDLSAAIEELKDMAGVRRVSLIGLRVGATLAALAALDRDDVHQVVLWDPVLNGHEYVTQLLEVQETWRQGRPAVRFPRGHVPEAELIGFPLSDATRAEYEQLDLRRLGPCRATRFDAVLSSQLQHDEVAACIGRLEIPCCVHVVPSAGDWQRPGAVHLALLPHEILQTIPTLLL